MRKATGRALFSKLLYISESEQMLSQDSEAVKGLDLPGVRTTSPRHGPSADRQRCLAPCRPSSGTSWDSVACFCLGDLSGQSSEVPGPACRSLGRTSAM